MGAVPAALALPVPFRRLPPPPLLPLPSPSPPPAPPTPAPPAPPPLAWHPARPLLAAADGAARVRVLDYGAPGPDASKASSSAPVAATLHHSFLTRITALAWRSALRAASRPTTGDRAMQR